MAKKLKKGNLITELVKGSLEYTRDWIVQQFRRQFPYSEMGPNYYIVDSFADHVVVESYSSPELMPSEFFMVAFTKSGDVYTFVPRDQWEIVELTYQPATRASVAAVSEGRRQKAAPQGDDKGGKKKGLKFSERINAAVVLEEREEGKPRKIKIEGAMTANVVNGNKRRYPVDVVRLAVDELRSHLNESAGQGRAIQVLGEAEHPSDKGGRPNLLETVTKWDKIAFDGTRVDISGRILETSKGKDILTLMEGGVMPGVSLRGYGEGKSIGKGDDKVFEVTELHITGFDLVLEPSFENAAQLIESLNLQGEFEMNELLEQLKKLLAEQPELFNRGMTEAQLEALSEKQLKKLDESLRNALGIGAEVNIIEAVKGNAEKAKKFDENQAKNAIAEAKAEAVKDLKFGKQLNEMFVESINEQEFANADSVKKFAESLQKQFSKMASKGVLKGMGFVEGKGLQVLGDVLENETGTPSYAKVAWDIQESIRKVEFRPAHNLKTPTTANEMFTKKLLERFDQLFMNVTDARTGLPGGLAVESRRLEEAEITTDLNLPYTVSRAIMAEAYPDLIAAGIFDVGVITQSPTRLMFERFAGESGYTATITEEVETGGAEGTWYALAHGRISPDSVTVTSNPSGTTYVEGTDYVIDYGAGRIKFLTPGSIGANDVLVSYDYTAIRNGEMAPIQRAEVNLDYITIEAAADRLADQISREAIVFAQSQLGYDTVAQTMNNLVKQMRRKIDQGLMYAAYSAVKAVASNSTDAWTVGTDQADLDELVRLMGAASILVDSRFYQPTFYLMSKTNAERLSHWQGFNRGGFPNATLAAAGFAGGVNGLPIFAGTEFPSSLIIAGNTQLVQHRVFSPMNIQGPFQSRDVSTGNLISASEYFAEEFNTTNSPVNEKGAFVPISGGS